LDTKVVANAPPLALDESHAALFQEDVRVLHEMIEMLMLIGSDITIDPADPDIP